MLDLETTLRRKLDTAGLRQGSPRLGIGELTAATWFPKFMRRAAADPPDLLIEPLVSQARSMEMQVERGTLDCAVIARPHGAPGAGLAAPAPQGLEAACQAELSSGATCAKGRDREPERLQACAWATRNRRDQSSVMPLSRASFPKKVA